MITRAKINKTYNYVLRGAIIIATYGFLYYQLFYEKNINESLAGFRGLWQSGSFWASIAAIGLMMLVNWGIESWKWKLLVSRLETVPFLKSYVAVLTGISVSAFTPNRTGDYFGRVFILDKATRTEGIFATIVGSMGQFLTTIIFGLFCSLYLIPFFFDPAQKGYDYFLYGMIVFVPAAVFVLVFLYFNIDLLPVLLRRFINKKRENWLKYIQVFASYLPRELLSVLLLSIARYVVFTLQFYWLLRIFSVDIPFIDGIMIIPVIFFLISVVPTVTLAELGIRGAVSVFVISHYFERTGVLTDETAAGIFAASTLIWLINLVIPALLGTFFVFRLKFFRNNTIPSRNNTKPSGKNTLKK